MDSMSRSDMQPANGPLHGKDTVSGQVSRCDVTSRPLLLDLFCGEGGASVGYYRAGFLPVGVDHLPKPRYPFHFVQFDALAYLDWLIASGEWRLFSAIHASPPCQEYCTLREFTTGIHPRLIEPVVSRLSSLPLPWVVENVERAPVPNGLMLCGSMFGLPVLRHRLFASSHLLFAPGRCVHDGRHVVFSRCLDGEYRSALGVPWMTARGGARQAIPPAYAEWLGRQLVQAVRHG